MTLRAPVRGLVSGEAPADAELVRYVCTVHRLAWGAPFVAFDPARAVEADARLERAGDAVVLHVGPLRAAGVVASQPITLIQGIAKGDKCDAIVRDATELGATRVLVTPMQRSVARPAADKLAARESRWQRIADEAARQSGRGDAPQVSVPQSLDAALDAALEGALGSARDVAGFVLWERATTPLGPDLANALRTARPLVFVIGPEGGIDEREVAACERRGFAARSLGSFVLRTETVAAAVLGAVMVVRGLLPAPGHAVE